LKGSQPLAETRNNREVVSALREIAEGKVMYAYPERLRGAKVYYRLIPDDTEFIGDEEYAD
jgi:DNA-directed RNA polymerase subunit omega